MAAASLVASGTLAATILLPRIKWEPIRSIIFPDAASAAGYTHSLAGDGATQRNAWASMFSSPGVFSECGLSVITRP